MVKLIFKSLGCCLIALLGAYQLFAQEKGGEIADTEIIIEKDKPLTLPKANRLYQPTELEINQFQPAPVQYNFNPVGFQPEGFTSNPPYRNFKETGVALDQDNYLKLGFGNYQSPLIEGNYTMRIEEHYLNTYLRHESFAKGPVRDKQSAFSDNQVNLKGHLDGDFHVDPFIDWSRESYYFYGRDTAFDSSNPLIIDDRIFLQNISVGATVRQGMDSKFDYRFTPGIRNTLNKVVGGNRIAAESELFLAGNISYQYSDLLSFGIGLNLQRHKYESVFLQTRNYFGINPEVTLALAGGSVKAGFEFASANDTTSDGGSVYFFPDIALNLDITRDFSVYGMLEGNLNVTNLYSISNENRYLENGLLLLNQVNKIDITGGIRSKILNHLQLDASLGYSVIENMPFFSHSTVDSSRFLTVYDSGSFARTTIGISVSYTSGKRFSMNYNMKYFGYAMNKLEEPWYKPNASISLLLNYQITENFKVSLNGKVMGGIQAPSPADLSAIKLPTIFDIGVGASYSINDQFSAFAQAQNLIGGNYERYLNYPVRGVAFKMGLAYHF